MNDSQDRPRRYTFPPRLRVRQRREFERALKTGLRVGDGILTMWALPNGLPHARLGLTVGRKHGGAVRRNRIKRLLREAFRRSQHELPEGLDFICAPRVNARFTLEACMQSLTTLARRLARRREGR